MDRKLMTEGLGQGLQNTLPKPLAKLVQPLLFALLGISKMDRIYNGACDLDLDDNFAEKLFHKDVMNIKLCFSDSDLKKIPKEGPLVVVANHPYGGIDGVALLALLKRVRPDVKLMANYILAEIPELKEHFLPVDPFAKVDSSRKSFGGIKGALKWLKDGHVLGIFPAGEVSTYNKNEKRIIDKEWAEMTSMLIARGKGPVSCVFFDGHNSKIFHLLGKIHPILRTLWLPREFDRHRNHDISLKIRKVVSAEICKDCKTSKELMDFLKAKTYAIKNKRD